MDEKQYNQILDTAAKVEKKAAEFHKTATDLLTTAQKVLDQAAASFLDGVQEARESAHARYDRTRAGKTWDDTTDDVRPPSSTPNSPGVEEQINDVVNRLKEGYKNTKRGAGDPDPLKTVQDLVNDIFNPKKDNDGQV